VRPLCLSASMCLRMQMDFFGAWKQFQSDVVTPPVTRRFQSQAGIQPVEC